MGVDTTQCLERIAASLVVEHMGKVPFVVGKHFRLDVVFSKGLRNATMARFDEIIECEVDVGNKGFQGKINWFCFQHEKAKRMGPTGSTFC